MDPGLKKPSWTCKKHLEGGPSCKNLLRRHVPTSSPQTTMFTSAELQRNASEVQRAAIKEPVCLSYHEKPRFVMMSMENYVRLSGVTMTVRPEGLPVSMMARIREIEDAYPVPENVYAGGLASLMDDEGPNGFVGSGSLRER